MSLPGAGLRRLRPGADRADDVGRVGDDEVRAAVLLSHDGQEVEGVAVVDERVVVLEVGVGHRGASGMQGASQ